MRQNDPEDIEGFLGPWGGFVDEVKISKPDEVTVWFYKLLSYKLQKVFL